MMVVQLPIQLVIDQFTDYSVKFCYLEPSSRVYLWYIGGLDRSSRRFLELPQVFSYNQSAGSSLLSCCKYGADYCSSMRAVFNPMIDIEQLGSVIEDAYRTARKFREVVDAMETEKWEQFDGTPVGEIFDNLMDLEHSLGLDKPSN